ncbi:Hypothetical protein, putative [Bodo saltans]|uniref:SET domain-containing protein n=1 Tax=Bodo saltans TaxID=75058 RepID=A0A0S4KLG7_BODSA|nr:Hypothetical protein, putative [Bodo saltans]|eukprot:CUI15209.1 Hypothetical protein, putative [Bodo saltans]
MDPLRQWAIKTGNMKIHADIIAQSIPSMGGGMGIIATKPIGAGHVLVQVPLSFMLTTKSAREYLLRTSPPPTELDTLTPVEAIMSFLLLAERDAQHVHYPWLRALPRCYDNLLELPYGKRLPRSSTAVEGADAQAYDDAIRSHVWSDRCRAKCVEERLRFEASVDRCRERIPLLRRGPSVTHAVFESCSGDDEESAAIKAAAGPQNELPLEKFLWAYNSLMSRGFSYDEDIWAMMPWVDYFNYSLFPNVTMRFNSSQKKYEFITKKKIQAGEQLMLQYGTYSDYELALWYGFTLRRVLFPNCKPLRVTQSDSDSSSSPSSHIVNDAEQTRTLNTHFAYVFSPTYDPNGDLPIGVTWAIQLIQQAGLVPPPSWGTTVGHDEALHDVRIAWGSVNEGMVYLLRQLVECNEDSSEVMLRKIARSELAAFSRDTPVTSAEQEASAATTGDVLSVGHVNAVNMARALSEDHAMLLRRYAVELDDAGLKSLLLAASAQ